MLIQNFISSDLFEQKKNCQNLICRWISAPHLFRLSAIGTSSSSYPNATTNETAALREQNFILARKNASLNDELISLKRFIESSRRSMPSVFSNIVNNAPCKSSLTTINNNEHSSAFDLASNLMQVNSLTIPNNITHQFSSKFQNKLFQIF